MGQRPIMVNYEQVCWLRDVCEANGINDPQRVLMLVLWSMSMMYGKDEACGIARHVVDGWDRGPMRAPRDVEN